MCERKEEKQVLKHSSTTHGYERICFSVAVPSVSLMTTWWREREFIPISRPGAYHGNRAYSETSRNRKHRLPSSVYTEGPKARISRRECPTLGSTVSCLEGLYAYAK